MADFDDGQLDNSFQDALSRLVGQVECELVGDSGDKEGYQKCIFKSELFEYFNSILKTGN